MAAAGLALAVYALGSHWLMVHAAHRPWAVAALFGPLLLAIAAGGWRRRHTPTLAFCAALLALLVVVVARGGVDDINRMYVLQHAGIHAALAWTFASTLRQGGTPLISALAERVHLNFTPAMRRYTRSLTRAWALYFVAMIALSVLLYAFAPWPWWSAFCNLVTPLAVAVFFVGEHVLRYRWHPEFERLSMRGAVQAWRDAEAAARAASATPAARPRG
jgi:uncharacterized membrane protein